MKSVSNPGLLVISALRETFYLFLVRCGVVTDARAGGRGVIKNVLANTYERN